MKGDCRPEGTILPAEMSLLLFHAGGVALGVEAAAVEGILDVDQARLLLFKGCEETRGLAIESLDEIVAVASTALQPLPEPLAYFRGPRAFWGCIVRANKVVLLVDVDRLGELPTAVGEAF